MIPKQGLQIFILSVLVSCVQINNGTATGEYDIPTLEMNCPGSDAADCLGNPGFSAGNAANKKAMVVWMQGKCSDNGTNVEIEGTSTGVTVDDAGSNVQYISSILYSNSETKITNGTYAIWSYFDTSNNGSLDIGEPVSCTDLQLNSEVGSLPIISGWRDATTTDQTTLQ